MKRAEIRVGQDYAAIPPNSHSNRANRVVVMDTQPWRNYGGVYARRRYRADTGNGVAVMVQGGKTWYPEVIPLSHIREEWTLWQQKELKQQQFNREYEQRRAERRQENKETFEASAKTIAEVLGLNVRVEGYGSASFSSYKEGHYLSTNYDHTKVEVPIEFFQKMAEAIAMQKAEA